MNEQDKYAVATGSKHVPNHEETRPDLKKMELIKEQEEAQYLEDNLEILEMYFMDNDGEGIIKDNIEDAFEAWLEGEEFDFLKSIIEKAK